MGPTSFRDGIFSSSAPMAKFGADTLRPYADGSLGTLGPQAFRDGVFSASDPLALPGSLLTSYSDGSLGAMTSAATVAQRQSCIQTCMPFRGRVAKYKCMRGCMNTSYQAALARQMKKSRAAAGIGALSTDTKIGLGVVGVLALALVAMPIMGSRKKRR